MLWALLSGWQKAKGDKRIIFKPLSFGELHGGHTPCWQAQLHLSSWDMAVPNLVHPTSHSEMQTTTIQTPHLQPLPSCMFFNGTHTATVTTLTLLCHKSKCGEQSDRFQMSENLLTPIGGSDECRNYNNKAEFWSPFRGLNFCPMIFLSKQAEGEDTYLPWWLWMIPASRHKETC